MLKKLFAVVSFCLTLTLQAQTGTITGTILDSESNEPLIGATVQIEGTTKGAVTDVNGKFSIAKLETGSYKLKISYYGYDGRSLTAELSGATTDVGTISMQIATVGLEEVQVMADIVEERKAPIAISTISSEQLDERFSNLSLAEAIQNTPGIYSIQGAGGYGDQEVYIRGFDQTNVAFLVNGIPVNDMENGRMYWSNFAGLSQVTRTTQVQRGLGASKLAVSSIGGTVNMITKPADRGEGGRVEYQTGTGSWNNRLRFTYNTGLSNDGWAFSFQGTRTTTSGTRDGQPANQQGAIMPGAFTDAWSYYISASKKINDKHQVMFWAFGAPVNRGSAWSVDDLTRERYSIDDPMTNNALGVKNGQIFNMRQNKVNKPLTAITHYWDLNETSDITTSVYFSRARVYSVQPKDADWFVFLNDRTTDMIGQEILPGNLINWDYLMEQNRTPGTFRTIEFPNGDPNTPEVSGYASKYYLEARYNNHDWVGLVSNFTKQINNVRVRGGIDMRLYRGEHYAEVFDLMGGDFIENESWDDLPYNKLDGQNAIAYKGDKTNYHYDGIVNWYSGFAQAEWVKDKWIFFGSGTLTFSDMQRIGYFWSGDTGEDFELTSLGKSEKRNSLSYILKAGANYRFDGRHNVFGNLGYFTRPPYLRNAFHDARYSNEYRQGLQDEKVFSTEIGYGYKSPVLKANINTYYLLWSDRTTSLDFEEINNGEITPISLTGLVSEHKGIELDFVANPITSLEINGYLGLGDWKWKEAPVTEIVTSGGVQVYDDLKVIEGLPVGTAAQTTAGIGLHYTGIRSTYVGGRLNYADRIPIRYNPEDLIEEFITPADINDKFDDYATVDFYAGRYFDVGENMSGRLSVSVNNVFDVEYTRWASFFFNQVQRGYGYTRTFTIGLSLDF